MLSPVHLVLPVVGGHYLAQHQGADVDHAHDPRKGHELVHKRVQFPMADLTRGDLMSGHKVLIPSTEEETH